MKTAEIHDLGYKRYDGPRRAASTRWQVIMRHQIAYAWKTWWRYKLPLVLALMTTTVFAALLYFLRSDNVKEFDRAGIALKMADFLLPLSIGGYTLCGFIFAMTVGAGTVSGDLKSGAFTFYFVRSTRPLDYVMGRFFGLVTLLAPIMLAGPLLLALLRLGLTDETDSLASSAMIVPKMLLVGVLGTIAYAAIPLAFSAIGSNRGLTIGMFALHYMVITSIFALVAMATTGAVASLDFPAALKQLAIHLFDIPLIPPKAAHGNGPQPADIPIVASVISLLVQSALALGFVMFKLNAQQRDVGGAS
jgi:hypothetical protein